MTVGDCLEQYGTLSPNPYGVSRRFAVVFAALKVGLGTLTVNALGRTDIIEDFKRNYGRTRSLVAANRTFGILRHAVNWGRSRTPAIFVASPFHRFNVKVKTKGETKRDRSDYARRRARLLKAAEQAQLRRGRVRGRTDA